MSVRKEMVELSSIEIEINRLVANLAALKRRKKDVKEIINKYLIISDLPGVRYKNIAVIRETKPARAPKKTKDRDTDAHSVLLRHGIRNPERVLKEVLESRRGAKVDKTVLKMEKIN
jgi:hypothetical protein